MKKIILFIFGLTIIIAATFIPKPIITAQDKKLNLKTPDNSWLEGHVDKFEDGNITCYIFEIDYGGGISCLKVK